PEALAAASRWLTTAPAWGEPRIAGCRSWWRRTEWPGARSGPNRVVKPETAAPGSRVGKPHLSGFPHQQRRIGLGHLADVVPQQGDALELAQVLPAVHPELPGDIHLHRQHVDQPRV